MENLPCEIVQDLLPSYADGLTSQVTNEAVDSHLSACDTCRETYAKMKTPTEPDTKEKMEIDFLKKARKKRRKTVVLSVFTAVVVIFALFSGYIFLIGTPVDASNVYCGASVSGNTVTLTGGILSSGLEISHISCQERNGILTVSLRGVPVGPFYNGGLNYSYTAKEDVIQIRLGNRIIWDRGLAIPPAAFDLYHTAHEYVGDMPANGETAGKICTLAGLGSFTSELKTDTPPYGWTIYLNWPQENEEKLYSSACVILSLVGNLDSLTFEYTIDHEEKSLTVTTEEASAAYGTSIKSAAETAADFQKLLSWSGLIPENPAVWGLSSDIVGRTQLWIHNETGEKIYSFGFDYYVDGQLFESEAMINADESSFIPGENILLSPDMNQTLEGKELTLEVVLLDAQQNRTSVSSAQPITIAEGFSYVYTLRKDVEGNYILVPAAQE